MAAGGTEVFTLFGTIFVPAGHFSHYQCTILRLELEGNKKGTLLSNLGEVIDLGQMHLGRGE